MLTNEENLKISLMTRGMEVSASAREAIGGEDERPLTLADYASTSGISMELEGGIWVNTPIVDFNPNFVSETPNSLNFDGQFFIRSGDFEVGVSPTPVPRDHDRILSTGRPQRDYAITHTDRVRISPIEGCAIACQFCDIPYSLKYKRKDLAGLVESVRVAMDDPVRPAHHVLISGGTPKKEDYDYEIGIYSAVASAFPDTSVDVMMVPAPGLLDPIRLKEIGINGLSINLELNNPEISRRYMHAKWKQSRERYLDFIEEAAPIFGEGNVRSLLMVGIEPMEDTLKGVRALAERGCDPVLSPFRPDPVTPLRNKTPPSEDFLSETYQRARDIVEEYPGVKMGPRCIPCMHNTLTFQDGSGAYFSHEKR